MRWTNILLLVCLALFVVEVDSKKKPKKPKKPKPAAKGVCFTKGPKPSAKLFAKYTKKDESRKNLDKENIKLAFQNVHAGGISHRRIAPAVQKRSISSVDGPCTSFAIKRNLRGSPKS